MSLHIKLTLMLLFANIMLALMYPAQVIGDNGAFTIDNGEYNLDSNLVNATASVVNKEGGLPLGLDGLTDIITLIWDFIVITFSILFSSFKIIALLEGVWRLIIGIPVGIAYIFAIVGWLK